MSLLLNVPYSIVVSLIVGITIYMALFFYWIIINSSFVSFDPSMLLPSTIAHSFEDHFTNVYEFVEKYHRAIATIYVIFGVTIMMLVLLIEA